MKYNGEWKQKMKQYLQRYRIYRAEFHSKEENDETPGRVQVVLILITTVHNNPREKYKTIRTPQICQREVQKWHYNYFEARDRRNYFESFEKLNVWKILCSE